MKKVLVSFALICSPWTVPSMLGQKSADRSFTKWSLKETQKILTDSPWAKQMTLTEAVTDTYRSGTIDGLNPRETTEGRRGYGISKDAGVAGDKEHYHTYTVRFYSALPVRQAHLRLLQINSKYDLMTPDQKRSFDEKYSYLLDMDVSRDIVISLEFVSNDQNLNLEVNQRLRQATKDLLVQSAYLISDRMNRVPLQAYIPPADDGTGAKLVFPRTVQGEPVIIARDREAKLEFFPPGTDQKVYVTWKIKDLVKSGVPIF